MLDFESLDREMTAAGAELPTAEVHGLMSALACIPSEYHSGEYHSGEYRPGEHCIALVQAEALGQRIGEPSAARGLVVLESAFDSTAKALDSEELAFQPALPRDDEPLGDRTEALGAWCAGFLAGLGLAGIGDFESIFSVDTVEFLTDLREMSRIELDPDEDSAAERAYVELVEYMRIGVIVVREELDALGPRATAKVLH